jgi:hypothetical protein
MKSLSVLVLVLSIWLSTVFLGSQALSIGVSEVQTYQQQTLNALLEALK